MKNLKFNTIESSMVYWENSGVVEWFTPKQLEKLIRFAYENDGFSEKKIISEFLKKIGLKRSDFNF